jgi:hypothetical protein
MSYAHLGEDHNPTGFTNNWLESRKNVHLFDQNYKDFALYNEHQAPAAVNNTYRDILKTVVERDAVSDMFFSHKNLQFLKHFICDNIYKKSGGLYRITPEAQSDNSLLEVMRSIYLEYSKHLPDQIKEQVAELNYLVATDMIPRTISSIQLNLAYQRDQSQQPLPMDRPQYVSSTGTKSNKSTLFS